MDLYEILQEQAKTRPDAVAIRHWHGGGRVTVTTFAELAAGARRVCFSTPQSGDVPSPSALPHWRAEAHSTVPVIPLFLAKSADCIAAMFGAMGAGCAFACLNRKLRPPQINSILQSIAPAIGYVDGPGLMVLASGLEPDTPIARTHWRIIRDSTFLPAHEKMVERMRKVCAVEHCDEAERPDHGSALRAENPCRAGCCLFTSGSTGMPKGVLISEPDLRARAVAEIDCFGITPRDVLLSILPFSFDVGLNQLLTAITVGCELVLMDSWLPADILRAVEQFKITGISGVPSIWSDMLAAGVSFDTTGPHRSLRYITVSGGDLPVQQLDRLATLAPNVGIFKTYGQTEAFRASALKPEEFATKKQSVGRPFGGVRIYIVREDGSQCAPNEEGEIVHTGLGTMLGYLDDNDPANKLRPNRFRGASDPSPHAVFTGDIGYLDADGYLYVKGRRDAMLKVSGNRVYPGEIVAQISAIGCAAAEVVGIKDARGETHLFAFVVLVSGSNLSDADIRRQLAARLPSYMVPRQVIILPSMPRTASGKPDRPMLTERARELLSQ